MPDHEPTPSSKPTLESLLRLKRHERPAQDFWLRFDRELRERALREFVRPEPIAIRWARVLLARVTPLLTAGATAALALGFLMNGHFAPFRSVEPVAPQALIAAAPRVATVNTSAADLASGIAGTATSDESSAPLQDVTPKFVVSTLAEPSGPSNYHKVPATATFAPDSRNGVQYAAESLNEGISAGSGRGMAY